MAVGDCYEDSGIYRICWCGPEFNRVYVAWVKCGEKYQRLGTFKHGNNNERHAAAKQCCREHWEMRQAG